LPEDTNAAILEFLEGLWAATTPRQTAPSSLTWLNHVSPVCTHIGSVTWPRWRSASCGSRSVILKFSQMFDVVR